MMHINAADIILWSQMLKCENKYNYKSLKYTNTIHIHHMASIFYQQILFSY